jgi:hypothetical protein
VTTLLSHADDGATESVLAVARQGTTTNHQGAVIDRQDATADCQGAITGRQGAAVDHQGAATDCQGVITDRQDATNVAASRPKKALATRCVDGGGHRSRCMYLYAGPTVGANCHGL